MTLSGFGNYHQSEALENALPRKQNSPQKCAFGLYAEQLSGSAFTRARANNLRSWLYRMVPSVIHNNYELYPSYTPITFAEQQAPNPYRWSPFEEKRSVDFVDGLFPIAGNSLINTYIYQCTLGMQDRYFSSSDGELLFVPYEGELNL